MRRCGRERGSDARIYTYGNVYDGSKFVHGWPEPVGSYTMSDSPYGVANMAGNVAEWTRDGFEWYVYNRYANGDFSQPGDGSFYMMRGFPYNFGTGGQDTFLTRIAYRYPYWHETRWIFIGSRVAFDPPL